MMVPIKIFTDGGCSGNPGPGGWAYVIAAADPPDTAGSPDAAGGGENIIAEKYGGEKNTTNNRMELLAAIYALEYVRELSESAAGPSWKITVYTDSQYVQKGMTLWLQNWKLKQWRTTGKEEVKNKDLWLRLDNLAGLFPVDWVWVAGHAGNELNERADRMTQMAIQKIKGEI